MPPRKKASVTGRNKLSDEDEKLWQRVTTTVKPLVPHHQRAYVDPPTEIPEETQSSPVRSYKQHHVTINAKPSTKLPDLDHGRAPGLDKRSSQRLKKGRMDIEARLDLHGNTQQEARRDLNSFVHRSYDRGLRCVLVITGKGMRLHSGQIGVLRRAVPQWLNENPLRSMILGFSHATPKDGGEGALYVLLKRKR
jgi:DNA-nicking Smr family endonuclease